ncbi:enamelin [Eublepharis macularius]|uniref:Enamelin n=1 Tax=Eublepharis macularius TaxID=481883 RepID=A0AA97JSA0_EUBMA|nr:enamelin [Eublepharis macularius]
MIKNASRPLHRIGVEEEAEERRRGSRRQQDTLQAGLGCEGGRTAEQKLRRRVARWCGGGSKIFPLPTNEEPPQPQAVPGEEMLWALGSVSGDEADPQRALKKAIRDHMRGRGQGVSSEFLANVICLAEQGKRQGKYHLPCPKEEVVEKIKDIMMSDFFTTSPLLLQCLKAITSLSHFLPALSWDLERSIVAWAFRVIIGESPGHQDAASQTLHREAEEALLEMLQGLYRGLPSVLHLVGLLDHLSYWMQNRRAGVRSTALSLYSSLLSYACRLLAFHDFFEPDIGHLLAPLALSLVDPEPRIREQARESVGQLYDSLLGQKGLGRRGRRLRWKAEDGQAWRSQYQNVISMGKHFQACLSEEQLSQCLLACWDFIVCLGPDWVREGAAFVVLSLLGQAQAVLDDEEEVQTPHLETAKLPGRMWKGNQVKRRLGRRRMKIIVLCLCLVSITCAIPLRKPRKAGFGSKSEEMMQFGPYSYLNSPQLAQLAPLLYGYRPSYPQLFPQPRQRFYIWPQQTPAHQAARLPQRKPHQTPAARQPIQRPKLQPQMPQQPHKPIQQQPHPKIQQPPKKPPSTSSPQIHHQGPVYQPKRVQPQQPQSMPPGFGHPPISNEEGTPYYGYGYHGLGNRRPYNSEEFENDYEKPKEKEAPKTESPATDPATNATDTNSTLSNPAGQVGNATNAGLSITDNGGNSPKPESRWHIGNGVPTLLPTLHVSNGDTAAQNGMDQSVHRASSPNINHIVQNLPSDQHQSTGNGLPVYKHYPGMENSRPNTYISNGNPSGHPETPTYPSGYGDNSNQRGNLQNNNNNIPINTRPNPYGQQEHPHYPERNPSNQRQIFPFPSSDPQSQWNKDPVYRDNNLNSFPPEGQSVDPQFNTLGQAENSYNTRKETDLFQPSGVHQLSSLSPQGVFSPTKRTLSEAETHQYPWKEQAFNPPVYKREQFSPPQNQEWNKQEELQVFQDDPPRYNSRHSSGYFGQRSNRISYPEKSSYDQPPRSFYPETWEGRENSPTLGPPGQKGRPFYSPQMQRNSYRRSDPVVQQESEMYPRPSPWAHEKRLHDLDREYRNVPYSPTQQHAYPKYSPENPSDQQRSNVPYKEIHPWTPEEHSPPYTAEYLRQTEVIPYRKSNAFGHPERTYQNEGANSPSQSPTLVQRVPQYSERDTWGPERMGPSVQKEASPYFNSYPPDFRRNPTHMEDTRSAPMSNANVAERSNYPDTLGYPDNYPREPRTIASYPTADHLCCEGNAPVPQENVLAPLRSVPQFRQAPWPQRGSSPYPEADGGHPKQAGHTLYPSGMQSSLKTEKSTPKQREDLGVFEKDAATLEKAPPCSRSQLSQQNEREVNYETGLAAPTRKPPCYGRSVRGDGHSIFEWIDLPKREQERAAPVNLIPEKGPPAQGIKSAALDTEGSRKQRPAVFGFKRIPCLGNQLQQYLSSTGAPSSGKQQDLFYAENPMLIGKSFIILPEPHPLTSTNPSYDTEEKPLTPSALGEDLADQPKERTPDCLLLQK